MLKYKVKKIDNFLKKKDFNDLCKIALKKKSTDNFNIFHNEINNDGVLKSSINKNLLKRLQKNYFNYALKILKKLYPEKVCLYDYSDFSIIITKKNSKFLIHDDTPNKLLSGVVYLHPKNNTGTLFYNNKKGSGKTTVKWKTNRAVFFARKEKITWHSYEGDGKNDRIALVFNLMTNNIKKVFEIEKTSAMLGKIRFKTNPYLMKYFNLNI